jgi:hypothetical protein
LSKSATNLRARELAFAIWRQTTNITVQLTSDSSARKPRTLCVMRPDVRISSEGDDGIAPRA